MVFKYSMEGMEAIERSPRVHVKMMMLGDGNRGGEGGNMIRN